MRKQFYRASFPPFPPFPLKKSWREREQWAHEISATHARTPEPPKWRWEEKEGKEGKTHA